MSLIGRDSDERAILERLGRFRTVGVAVPARVEAARRLERRGLVRTWPGEGKDAGLLMVQVEWRRPVLLRPDVGPNGGGAA